MWSKKTIAPEYAYCWRLGKKEFMLRKKELQWDYLIRDCAERVDEVVVAKPTEVELIEDWQTAIGEKNNILQVLPTLPDLPLVIRADRKFTVLPGKSVMLYVPIPICLQFYAGSKKKEQLIFESPSEDLSQTWFGEFHNGMLAYSWPLDLSQILVLPEQGLKHYVVCPLKLTNDANSILDVQRLLLSCEYLSIYGKDNALFTNEVKIRFKGENDVSDVQYASQAPTFIPHKALLNSARSSKISSVISKSFHFIKSLSNY